MYQSNVIKEFSQTLFWDVNKSELDLTKHRRFIIERTMTHGTLSDWFLIKNIYGKELIKSECLKIRYLDKQTLAFCSAYFNEPIQNFICVFFIFLLRPYGIFDEKHSCMVCENSLNVFHVDFRCYTLRQSNPAHWDY